MAYTFFENYHQAVKEYADGNLETYGRMMLIINTYAIEGVILDDLNPVEKLFFTTLKASLDKSLEIREQGKKGGRPKKNLGKNPTFNPTFNEVEVEVEKELEKEKEVEIVRNYDSILTTFSTKNNFTIRDPAKTKIINRMKPISDPESLLENHLEFVKGKYPNKTNKEIEALFIKSFDWENIFPEFYKEKKPKKDSYKGAPTMCSFCGAKLIKYAGVPGVVLCPSCNEKGIKTFWEKENNVWKCNR